MFRWASPLPIPASVDALLQRAGVVHSSWGDRHDLTLFLPPHAWLEAGHQNPRDLSLAYSLLEGAGTAARLVNGERLLVLGAAEISHWLLGHPLRRPLTLQPVHPLLAAATLAQLETKPELAAAYQRLDGRSERGGAAVDANYSSRLTPSAGALLEVWRELQALNTAVDQGVTEWRRREGEALVEQLELQLLANRELSAQLGRARMLLRRLMRLQTRVLWR